jgi:hypothetical protein
VHAEEGGVGVAVGVGVGAEVSVGVQEILMERMKAALVSVTLVWACNGNSAIPPT